MADDTLTAEDLAFLAHVCLSNAERHERLANAMSEEDRAGSSTVAIAEKYRRIGNIFERMLKRPQADPSWPPTTGSVYVIGTASEFRDIVR